MGLNLALFYLLCNWENYAQGVFLIVCGGENTTFASFNFFKMLSWLKNTQGNDNSTVEELNTHKTTELLTWAKDMMKQQRSAAQLSSPLHMVLPLTN